MTHDEWSLRSKAAAMCAHESVTCKKGAAANRTSSGPKSKPSLVDIGAEATFAWLFKAAFGDAGCAGRVGQKATSRPKTCRDNRHGMALQELHHASPAILAA